MIITSTNHIRVAGISAQFTSQCHRTKADPRPCVSHAALLSALGYESREILLARRNVNHLIVRLHDHPLGRAEMRKGDLTIAFKVIGLSDRLSDSQKRVASAILDHFNRKTGRCDPSQSTLAEILGISRRTVIRAMGDLEAIGFFRKDRHGGNFHCNHYTPMWSRFREADAAWDNRRRKYRARFERAEMSPPQCQDRHLSGDKTVTQTIPNNLSYRTSGIGSARKEDSKNGRKRSGCQTTTMELIGKPSHADAGMLHVKQTGSRDAMREAAHRRWDSDLLTRFRHQPSLYARIVDLVDRSMAEAATEAELKRRHAGAEYLIQQVALRDLKLAAQLNDSSEGAQDD